MRLRTRSALAALPLVLALSLAGCGGEEKQSGIPQGGNGGAGGGNTAGAKLSPDEMGVKFAECMRKNGVDMEDPKPGQGIQFRVNPENKDKMEKAQEACRQFNPMAQSDGKPDPEADERGRKFAECMRKNGVESFPDPKPGQRGIRITGETGKDPDMDAAMEKCRKEFGPMGPGGGPGGGAQQ
ncbi:hypothetical protein [Actinomadura rugatobispora]|uniref:Uncharacterized protein n=1 Tax=Actinomadura rugatobispora TaxID=1994 RepID=A0ABW1A7R4_9ACTN|nr:hypothetical protein GCM10010200_026490 [Actinomadura rugatobispora]